MWIDKGTVLNNLKIKPLLTYNLNATYDDFVPYTVNGDTLMSDVAQINESLSNLKTLQFNNATFIVDGKTNIGIVAVGYEMTSDALPQRKARFIIGLSGDLLGNAFYGFSTDGGNNWTYNYTSKVYE